MEMKRQDLSARSLTLGLPPCILAVDDDEMSLMMIERILGESYEIVKVTSGKDALAYLSEHTVDLVLLDYMMPENDGITVLRRIRETLETADLPVILLTGDMTADLEARGFQAGATDFLHKPFFPDVLRLRVARILRYEYLQTHLEIEVEHKTALAEERLASSERLLNELILALAKTVDVKDRYTSGHSERVATYAREIARRAGDGEKAQETIYAVGLLHDIGKIGVPIDIINKTSRLTDEEYELVKAHTTAGASILKTVSEFPALSVGARSHHERYDGRGYPDGLKGEDIPRMARIIAVADAYDAMTSRRSYRDALPQDVARSEIVKGRGTQFDPQFADIMLQMIDEDTEYMMRDKSQASPRGGGLHGKEQYHMTEQKTVLIIDDDEMNRMVAKMVLEKSVGCRVIAAPGGFDGITVMSMEPVDLVLLDLEMPELDGFQTLDIVQKRPDLAAIPVILLTASSDRDTVVRGSTYGIRDYIKKPFLPDDLARRVKKLLLN